MSLFSRKAETIRRVAGSVTHAPYEVEVAGTTIEVPRPTVRTVLLAEPYLVDLVPDGVPLDEASLVDMIRHTAKAGSLARVAGIYLTGADDDATADELARTWTITDLMGFVMEVMMRGNEVADFFAFTTSLGERSLLARTKEVETASGL